MIPIKEIKDNRSIPISRFLQEFSGLDLNSDFTELNFTHSPDALNVYKDYQKGKALIGRPGLKNAFSVAGEVKAHITATINNRQQTLLWVKNDTMGKIYRLNADGTTTNILTNGYSDAVFFSFGNKIYFKNQSTYACSETDGNGNISAMIDVLTIATIPTTSFNREPMGGGEDFNPVNILQSKRRNSFVGNGEDTEYYLDVETFDSINEVKVNDVVVTNFSTEPSEGKITFATAPPKPGIRGQDNVVITFTKATTGYSDRFIQSKILTQYDNRIFFSGNPTYPNAVFNSQREDPTYLPDIFYYEDGLDTDPVVDMIEANKGLFVLKGGAGDNVSVYFHQGKIFYENDMKVYPSTQTKIKTPCKFKGINFNSELVYISEFGLQGLVADYNSEFRADLRSTFILDVLKNATSMTLWKGYLLIAVGKNIYLADSKSRMETVSGLEYNWFKWEVPETITNMFTIGENLYVTNKGQTRVFDNNETKDINANGELVDIIQYWKTFFDMLEAPNRLKTLNKRGLVIYGENLEISTKTEPTPSAVYKNYVNLNFNKGCSVIKLKEKKILGISFSLKAKKDKRFILHNMEYEAFTTRYAKR